MSPISMNMKKMIPLLIINNSGINGAESKWDSDPMLLINKFNEYTRNKFLSNFWSNREVLITSKIHNYPLETFKRILLMEHVGIVRPILSYLP